MSLIYFHPNPAELTFSLPGQTLYVIHSKYELMRPSHERAKTMPFKAFCQNPRDAVRGIDHLVLVGITRMINPGNRTQMVWEVVYNNTPDLHKLVVDSVPFVGDPWRIWFAFGAVGAPYMDYTYSYIAESHYAAFVNGLRPDNPFARENVLQWGRDVLVSSYSKWFTNISVTERRVPDSIHREYARQKIATFEEEFTLDGILRRLGRFAQRVCPERSIPTGVALWDRRDIHIVKTDLPVDAFITDRILERISLTNDILEGCYGQNGGL